jgi:hypothetical protein
MSRQEISEQLSKAAETLKMPRALSLLNQLKVSSALDKLERQLHIVPPPDRNLHTRLATVRRKLQSSLVANLPDAHEPLQDTKRGRDQVSDRRNLLALIAEFGDVLNQSYKLSAEGASGRCVEQRPNSHKGPLDEEPVAFAGPVIKSLIGQSGLSQNEIGRRCGIPKHDLSRYLSDSMQMRLKHVRLVAEVLEVKAEDIVRIAFDTFLEEMQRTPD